MSIYQQLADKYADQLQKGHRGTGWTTQMQIDFLRELAAAGDIQLQAAIECLTEPLPPHVERVSALETMKAAYTGQPAHDEALEAAEKTIDQRYADAIVRANAAEKEIAALRQQRDALIEECEALRAECEHLKRRSNRPRLTLEEARGIAARCWTTPTTSNLVMDTPLCEAFAQALLAAVNGEPAPHYSRHLRDTQDQLQAPLY